MAPGRSSANSSGQRGPSLQERQAQSLRDKQAHSMRLRAAAIASIPKGPPKKKQELFTQGALKSFQFAPRGHGYYDAFVQKPETASVSATTGPATVITGYSSDTITALAPVTGNYTIAGSGGLTTSHTGNATLILFNPGASGDVVGEIISLQSDANNTLSAHSREIRCAQFSAIGNSTLTHDGADFHWRDANGAVLDNRPTRQVEQIPLRGSLRIRNITEALSVGGVVRMLRYNGGFHLNAQQTGPAANHSPPDDPAGVLDPEAVLNLCSMIRDAPRTRVFSGHELEEMHQSNTYPADFVRSMAFESTKHFRQTVSAPSYCTLMILVDDFVSSSSLVNNSYEVNVMVQRAARFGFGTLLGGMARELRVKPHDKAQDDHMQESSKPAATPLRDQAVAQLVKKFGRG